jgi:hypothetical protein
MTGTLSPPIPIIGQPNSAEDPITKEALEYLRNGLNAILASDNTVDPALFNTANKVKFKWYEPKIIATEESRTNTAFGTLTTADEIQNVVLNENGLIVLGYAATIKNSVAGAGRVAIFLGANQLKWTTSAGTPVEAESIFASNVGFNFLTSSTYAGLQSAGAEKGSSQVTTGQLLAGPEATPSGGGGLAFIFAASGTYNISIKYRSTSGSVTVKERKLWVATLG